MSVITDVWRQLVQRRLWPLALLLVAALVAVPLVLAKTPEVTAEAPVANDAGRGVTKELALATEPIVTLADATDRGPRAKVLGSKHDIFKPTAKAVKVEEPKTTIDDGTPDTGSAPKTGGDAGSTGGTGTGTTTPPPAETPEEPKQTYPPHSLLVRFGAGGETVKGYLPEDRALPSASDPLIIYVGLTDRNKTAVFMLDSTITAQGDGECHPTPENCETVHLHEGDTEFFDTVGEDGLITGEGFQLDLVKINEGGKTSDEDAGRSTKSAKSASVLQTGLGARTPRRLGVVGRTG